MKKIIVAIVILFSCFVQAHMPLFDGLTIDCKNALQQFMRAEQQQTLLSYDSMVQIFLALPTNYKEQRKIIRTDIKNCRQFIRKLAQNSIEYQGLLQELLALYDYIKKYKECGKAIYFHEQLQRRYELAFNNPDIVQIIEMNPALCGVERCTYKCRAYFKKISKDLRILDKFEGLLHGDFCELKAHNYVYQRELITIRNFVYHHNIYKFETRYF